ncbi:hypothetical protein [Modicisalibacter sp. MOD 31.J]|uniref:hypothetical protein n=1 Tax=Modicisalibacter sp. MOD 31.J TaxID=2831897 RepID=UPI001CCF7557|nr:hypothetical protein [Modicisalibacter sp. MOD 31.J]MBZ9574501.1 hypothetical protein [Modicisalibacter sp. MOD 31.J]
MLKQTVAVSLFAGALGAGVALAGAWWLGAFEEPPMPVAVVNLGGLVQAAAGGEEVDQEAMDAGFEHMKRVGDKLAAKGYLVLDASAVINAPETFYVPKRSRVEQGGLNGS